MINAQISFDCAAKFDFTTLTTRMAIRSCRLRQYLIAFFMRHPKMFFTAFFYELSTFVTCG